MNGQRKNIVILGSTGSIGENAVKVALHLKDELRVVGLAAGSNFARLAEQAELLDCPSVAIADDSRASKLANSLPEGCGMRVGMDGIVDMVTGEEVDVVLCAIVGADSLRPVLETLRAGKTLALASKEALVMAGSLVMRAASESGALILPVDSEHSAVFQCLDGRSSDDISRIVLTASGGSFRDWTVDRMSGATLDDALAHPTWNMGPKVTIDSATLMNKALEVIEASWLFDVPGDGIDVLIHRESIVHSMVEFIDGTVLAQMGTPDMRHPIQYALTYPVKHNSSLPPLNLASLAKLSFEIPDRNKYPSLDFAYESLKTGGTMPAVMNAANEVAVDAFRTGDIGFTHIWSVIEWVMGRCHSNSDPSLDEVMAADAEGRVRAREKISGISV